MNTFLFAIASVVPIFALILLGVFIRARDLIDDEFIRISNRIVFRFAMPVLVFQKMRTIEGVPIELIGGLGIFVFFTIIAVALTWILYSRSTPAVRGSVVQGAYRSNLAIIGLAVIQNSFSHAAVTYTLVLIAVVMPVYNILAIVILGAQSEVGIRDAILKVLRDIATNPLILATVAGLLYVFLPIRLPEIVDYTLDFFAQITLPLALICIGGSLKLANMLKGVRLWGGSVIVKLILLPVVVYIFVTLAGLTDEIRAILVVEAACPTAVTSFVMADNYGADSKLAGEIVSISTILSIITIPIWISILI